MIVLPVERKNSPTNSGYVENTCFLSNILRPPESTLWPISLQLRFGNCEGKIRSVDANLMHQQQGRWPCNQMSKFTRSVTVERIVMIVHAVSCRWLESPRYSCMLWKANWLMESWCLFLGLIEKARHFGGSCLVSEPASMSCWETRGQGRSQCVPQQAMFRVYLHCHCLSASRCCEQSPV